MGRSRIVRGAFVVLVVGVLLSALATVLTISYASERRGQLIAVEAEQSREDVDRDLAAAIAVQEQLVEVIDGSWTSAAQYDAVSLRVMATIPAGGRLQTELFVDKELVHRVVSPDLASEVEGSGGSEGVGPLIDLLPAAALIDLEAGVMATHRSNDDLLTTVSAVDIVPPEGAALTGLQLGTIDLRAIADRAAPDSASISFDSGQALGPDPANTNQVVLPLDLAVFGDRSDSLYLIFDADPGFAARRIPDPTLIALICGFLTLLAAAVTASLLGVHEVGERLIVSEHDADHDELTGTWNRRRLLAELELFTAPVADGSAMFGLGSRDFDRPPAPRVRGTGSSSEKPLLAVLFCDLDRFKVVNDSVGHAVGDEVLTVTGRRLAALHPQGEVTRFGGDEFVLTAPVESADEATSLAENLRYSVGREIYHEGSRYSISASVGVAVAERGSGTGPSDLLRDADMAAYSAKSAGGDAVVLFDDGLRVAAMRRLDTEQALRLAIANDEFSVLYQPFTDPAGYVIAAEALVRWDRPGHGLVSPGEFLAAASEIGLMNELGRFVMRRACEDGALWLADLPSDHPFTININVDIEQLLDVDLSETVLLVLEETGFPPDRLVLEITENALPGITESIRQSLETLRQAGVEFSIDDFGTGHSSLERLVLFDEVSEVKIDRSFTSRADSSVAAMAVVKAIALLAHDLDLRIVLEGVERPEEIEATTGLGISAYQGFLLGRPVAASVVTRDYLVERVPRMPNLERSEKLVRLATDPDRSAAVDRRQNHLPKPSVGLS